MGAALPVPLNPSLFRTNGRAGCGCYRRLAGCSGTNWPTFASQSGRHARSHAVAPAPFGIRKTRCGPSWCACRRLRKAVCWNGWRLRRAPAAKFCRPCSGHVAWRQGRRLAIVGCFAQTGSKCWGLLHHVLTSHGRGTVVRPLAIINYAVPGHPMFGVRKLLCGDARLAGQGTSRSSRDSPERDERLAGHSGEAAAGRSPRQAAWPRDGNLEPHGPLDGFCRCATIVSADLSACAGAARSGRGSAGDGRQLTCTTKSPWRAGSFAKRRAADHGADLMSLPSVALGSGCRGRSRRTAASCIA